MPDEPLNVGTTITLDATGAGRAELGPDRGKPYWRVEEVILMTDRPGVAPIPRCVLYLDDESANGLQGVTYDASFNTATAGTDGLPMCRGQHLIALWTGGAAGDQATISLTGRRSDVAL